MGSFGAGLLTALCIFEEVSWLTLADSVGALRVNIGAGSVLCARISQRYSRHWNHIHITRYLKCLSCVCTENIYICLFPGSTWLIGEPNNMVSQVSLTALFHALVEVTETPALSAGADRSWVSAYVIVQACTPQWYPHLCKMLKVISFVRI